MLTSLTVNLAGASTSFGVDAKLKPPDWQNPPKDAQLLKGEDDGSKDDDWGGIANYQVARAEYPTGYCTGAYGVVTIEEVVFPGFPLLDEAITYTRLVVGNWNITSFAEIGIAINCYQYLGETYWSEPWLFCSYYDDGELSTPIKMDVDIDPGEELGVGVFRDGSYWYWWYNDGGDWECPYYYDYEANFLYANYVDCGAEGTDQPNDDNFTEIGYCDEMQWYAGGYNDWDATYTTNHYREGLDPWDVLSTNSTGYIETYVYELGS